MNLRNKIQIITDGEYAEARRMVDALRTELGQPPAPSLQQSLEEKNAAYVLSNYLPLGVSIYSLQGPLF